MSIYAKYSGLGGGGGGGGGGDVTGPDSSTDSGLATFNGTDGKTLNSLTSTATEDNLNNLTILNPNLGKDILIQAIDNIAGPVTSGGNVILQAGTSNINMGPGGLIELRFGGNFAGPNGYVGFYHFSAADSHNDEAARVDLSGMKLSQNGGSYSSNGQTEFFVGGGSYPALRFIVNGIGTIKGDFECEVADTNYWGATVAGDGMSPFKGVGTNRIMMAYAYTDTIPTIPSGTIKVKTGTNLVLDADKTLLTGGLGVGNSASATVPGAVVAKMEVFDASGTSLGFVPIYSSIT